MSSFKYDNIKKYIKQGISPYITNVVLLLKSALIYRPKLCPGFIQPYYGILRDNHPAYGDEIYIDWWLCDGTNNTPDLRNKFIMGSNTSGAVGGSNTHSHSVSVITDCTVNSTSLTTNQIPSHTHRFEDRHTGIFGTNNPPAWPGAHSSRVVTYAYGAEGLQNIYGYLNGDQTYHNTESSGSGRGHTHLATAKSSASSNSVSNLPPYMTLCFVMYQKV